jgi:hypothetical protein
MATGSGFQLDINQLTTTQYRVTVTMTSSTNYPVSTANTASGGLWPYDYNNAVYTNISVLSASQALILAQGNIRWQKVLEQLDGISDCRIYNVSVTAANGSGLNTDITNQPTALSFTVAFDRDEFILGEWNIFCKLQGNAVNGTYTNPYDSGIVLPAYTGFGGVAITTTAIALQDIVTYGICSGGTTGLYRAYRVYNPTQGDTHTKVTITQPNTYATIYPTVSVTQIAGTTISGSPQ